MTLNLRRSAEDIGKCAYGIFKKGSEMIGKRIGIAGGKLTGNEMARALSKALREPVVYNKVPAAVYRSFGFPGADDWETCSSSMTSLKKN